jgi:hypothetical protein
MGITQPPTNTGKRAKPLMSSPGVGLGGSIFTTAQPMRKKPINQGVNFFMPEQ